MRMHRDTHEKEGRVPDSWWEAYLLRLMETKEADAERLERIAGVDSLGDKGGSTKARRRKKVNAET
jgi:hypothetical protein